MKLFEKLSKIFDPLPEDFTPCYACVSPKRCSKNRDGCGVWNKTQKATHTIEIPRNSVSQMSQQAFGEADLMKCVRQMLFDGHTKIIITKLP